MKKVSDKQREVFGKIAAMQTVLERYPVLTTTDPMLSNVSINTSIGFMLELLTVLGVTQDDLIGWLTYLLTGGNNNAYDGILNVIEAAVKAILLANLKDLFTCSVNPLLPDCLMKYSNPIFPDGTRPDPCNIPAITSLSDYRKIEIDLNKVDLFGTLSYCPCDKNGSIFYFDSYDSIFTNNNDPIQNSKGSFDTYDKLVEGVKNPQEGDIYKTTDGIDKFYIYTDKGWKRYIGTPYYTMNTLWKSCDFNAYLWYIINKGTLSNLTDLQYSCWDNRCQYIKPMREDSGLRTEFFNIGNCTGSTKAEEKKIKITNPSTNNSVFKKQIILCEFEERPTPSASEATLPSSNVLRVWINANRYYKTDKIKTKKKDGSYAELALNKTILEFNYDYIYSLKLFDTKTLVAQIVNSLLGMSSSFSASLSIEQKFIEGKVGEIVKKVIEADDQATSDCYFKFSNDEYNALLTQAFNSFHGRYASGNAQGTLVTVNSDKIVDSLMNLRGSTDQVQQQTIVKKTLEEITGTASEQPQLYDEINLTYGFNFIKNFINETVVQITLQILSPKVAILYAINGAVMGSEIDNMASWEDFLKKYQNLLFTIIRQVKDIIVEELYKFLMDKLKPLLELMISRIIRETIQYYRDLIMQIIKECSFTLPGANSVNSIIDNVQYADIVGEQTEPNTDKCS